MSVVYYVEVWLSVSQRETDAFRFLDYISEKYISSIIKFAFPRKVNEIIGLKMIYILLNLSDVRLMIVIDYRSKTPWYEESLKVEFDIVKFA